MLQDDLALTLAAEIANVLFIIIFIPCYSDHSIGSEEDFMQTSSISF